MNTGPISLTRSDRWILSEFLVAKDRIERFGDTLLYHRQKTPYAEVDLIFDSRLADGSRVLNMIEVKSVGAEIWGPDVVGRRQIERLMRARAYIEKVAQKRTSFLLACVNPIKSEIRYFEAPFI